MNKVNMVGIASVLVILLVLISCQDVEESDLKKESSLKIEGLDEFTKDAGIAVPSESAIETVAVPKPPSCGDGKCSGAENKCSCESDCGRCAGFASNLTQWKCIGGECALAKVEGICGNGLCESGELSACRIDCPDCTDRDACTIDSFNPTDQKCMHQQVTPCCSNSLCESGEDDRCLVDCPRTDSQNITLASYPYPFVEYPKFNANIIVGSNASAELVIAGIDVVRTLTFKEAGSGYSTNALLDTQVSSIANKNVILIGNGCQNKWSRALLLPASNGDCKDGLKPGEGLLRLYKTGDTTYAVVIAGYDGSNVRTAAKVLSEFNASKQSRLSGLERRI